MKGAVDVLADERPFVGIQCDFSVVVDHDDKRASGFIFNFDASGAFVKYRFAGRMYDAGNRGDGEFGVHGVSRVQ